MKIIPLRPKKDVYSCFSYLLLGSWNRINDVNTLIDTGVDASILEQIEKINTGVGKIPIERIILTHNHFDHTGGLTSICKKFNPEVCAFMRGHHVTRLLSHGECVRVGDSYAEVIHLPAHSEDSIALYCPAEKLAFTGDSPLDLTENRDSLSPEFRSSMNYLARMPIEKIFTGHDLPINKENSQVLQKTWQKVSGR